MPSVFVAVRLAVHVSNQCKSGSNRCSEKDIVAGKGVEDKKDMYVGKVATRSTVAMCKLV